MDSHTLHYKQRKRHLKEFNQRAQMVLTQRERSLLYGSLKEYQAYRQVWELLIYFYLLEQSRRKVTFLFFMNSYCRNFMHKNHAKVSA